MLSFGRTAPCPLRRRAFAQRRCGESPYGESIVATPRAPMVGSMMDAVKLALVGAVLLLLGGASVVFGVLAPADALAIADRVWPILLFVVAVTIVAELAAAAGVFDVVAARLARWSRGRTLVLWLLIVAFAVFVTAFLSLDTTAVLLTPVVVAVARAHRLPPLPFALATVWLANTASLFLPISNLTNLLAAHRLGHEGDALAFLGLLGPSALVAVLVTVVLLWLLQRRHLRGRFVLAPAPRVADPVLLRVTAAVLVVMLPLLVVGVPPWMPALAAALILTAVFAWRSPGVLNPQLVPWQLVVFASGLFLAVGALEAWCRVSSSPRRSAPATASVRSCRSPASGCWRPTRSTICRRTSRSNPSPIRRSALRHCSSEWVPARSSPRGRRWRHCCGTNGCTRSASKCRGGTT